MLSRFTQFTLQTLADKVNFGFELIPDIRTMSFLLSRYHKLPT